MRPRVRGGGGVRQQGGHGIPDGLRCGLQPLQQVGKRWIIHADNMMPFLQPSHACAQNLRQSQ